MPLSKRWLLRRLPTNKPKGITTEAKIAVCGRVLLINRGQSEGADLCFCVISLVCVIFIAFVMCNLSGIEAMSESSFKNNFAIQPRHRIIENDVVLLIEQVIDFYGGG